MYYIFFYLSTKKCKKNKKIHLFSLFFTVYHKNSIFCFISIAFFNYLVHFCIVFIVFFVLFFFSLIEKKQITRLNRYKIRFLRCNYLVYWPICQTDARDFILAQFGYFAFFAVGLCCFVWPALLILYACEVPPPTLENLKKSMLISSFNDKQYDIVILRQYSSKWETRGSVGVLRTFSVFRR